MSNNKDLLNFVAGLHSPKNFQELHWEGSFGDYLDLVKNNPNISRNAFQRMYDMIMGFGTSQFNEYKKEIFEILKKDKKKEKKKEKK